jgi:hypothetical protein
MKARCFTAIGLIVAAGMLLTAAPAAAQRLDLAISPQTISFPLADPDTVPIVSSVSVQLTYRVRQNDNDQPWTLTVLAMGDLISGLSTVDIGSVSWIATPAPPFQNGTLSKTVAQRLAGGIGNLNPTATGQIAFRLANSWTYTAGLYTQTIVFTLSSP